MISYKNLSLSILKINIRKVKAMLLNNSEMSMKTKQLEMSFNKSRFFIFFNV